MCCRVIIFHKSLITWTAAIQRHISKPYAILSSICKLTLQGSLFPAFKGPSIIPFWKALHFQITKKLWKYFFMTHIVKSILFICLGKKINICTSSNQPVIDFLTAKFIPSLNAVTSRMNLALRLQDSINFLVAQK